LYSRDSIISRNATISGDAFGTSTPTAPLPGIGATMRMLGAASQRQIVRERRDLPDLHARGRLPPRTA
jgi:hypothetical protein